MAHVQGERDLPTEGKPVAKAEPIAVAEPVPAAIKTPPTKDSEAKANDDPPSQAEAPLAEREAPQSSSAAGGPVPVPIIAPVGGIHEGNTLTQDQAEALPPVTDQKDASLSEPVTGETNKGVAAPIAAAAVVPAAGGVASEHKESPVGYEDAPAAATDRSVAQVAEDGAQPVAPLSTEPAAAKEAPIHSAPLTTEPTVEKEAPAHGAGAAAGVVEPDAVTPKKKPTRSVSFKEDQPVAPATPPPSSTTAATEPETAAPLTTEKEAPLVAGTVSPILESEPGSVKGEGEGISAGGPDYLSSAEITEMPGIGGSTPETAQTEAGSVLTGGTDEPKALTGPERQAVHQSAADRDQAAVTASPLTRLQQAHEEAEADVRARPPEIAEISFLQSLDCLTTLQYWDAIKFMCLWIYEASSVSGLRLL